jgi:hypothetical protein
MAKARQLIAGSSFGPEKVTELGRAFDEAWELIKEAYQSRLAIEAARLKLANAVLNLAEEGPQDYEQLKDRAVRILSVDKT